MCLCQSDNVVYCDASNPMLLVMFWFKRFCILLNFFWPFHICNWSSLKSVFLPSSTSVVCLVSLAVAYFLTYSFSHSVFVTRVVHFCICFLDVLWDDTRIGIRLFLCWVIVRLNLCPVISWLVYKLCSCLHLATSEMWCRSGGRQILTELSLCYSIVYYYNDVEWMI